MALQLLGSCLTIPLSLRKPIFLLILENKRLLVLKRKSASALPLQHIGFREDHCTSASFYATRAVLIDICSGNGSLVLTSGSSHKTAVQVSLLQKNEQRANQKMLPVNQLITRKTSIKKKPANKSRREPRSTTDSSTSMRVN